MLQPRTPALTLLTTAIALNVVNLSACRGAGQESPNATPTPGTGTSPAASSAPGQSSVDGISLPAGFRISVFADGIGPSRHMVTRPNGDVYVRLDAPQQGKCLAALRDGNGDGRADQTRFFGDSDCGTGLAIDQRHLYYSSGTEIWRQALGPELVPTAAPERVARNLGTPSQHNARSLTLDGAGNIYVNIGAPSNACQTRDRTPGSPGQDPCPILDEFGGVWRFDTNKRDQDKLRDGLRYVTGIRNAVALDWNRAQNKLFLLQHGRDQLDTLFPQHYSEAENSTLPAEEFAGMNQGDNLGWPYCYYDPDKNKKVLMPEYGGDGEQVGRCAQFLNPLVAFPAHYAPNDLIFYQGDKWPAEYRQGAFIAFHGSWNRGDRQEGYHVAFVPFSNGKPGQWRVFASGFAGPGVIRSSGQARYRPVGLAETPDGALLVVDSKEGRIWKISHG